MNHRFLFIIALLLTAATGAWAQTAFGVFEVFHSVFLRCFNLFI